MARKLNQLQHQDQLQHQHLVVSGGKGVSEEDLFTTEKQLPNTKCVEVRTVNILLFKKSWTQCTVRVYIWNMSGDRRRM